MFILRQPRPRVCSVSSASRTSGERADSSVGELNVLLVIRKGADSVRGHEEEAVPGDEVADLGCFRQSVLDVNSNATARAAYPSCTLDVLVRDGRDIPEGGCVSVDLGRKRRRRQWLDPR